MTLLQGPTNQTKHDVISPEILKAGVHLHLLEWHDALVVQQNRKVPWKKRRATQRSTSEWKIAQQTTSFLVQKHSNTGNHTGGSPLCIYPSAQKICFGSERIKTEKS